MRSVLGLRKSAIINRQSSINSVWQLQSSMRARSAMIRSARSGSSNRIRTDCCRRGGPRCLQHSDQCRPEFRAINRRYPADFLVDGWWRLLCNRHGEATRGRGTHSVQPAKHCHLLPPRAPVCEQTGHPVVAVNRCHPWGVSVTAHPAHDFRCWQYGQHGQITEMPKNAVFPGQSSGL